MGILKSWAEMTIEEKLETLRCGLQFQQHQSAAMVKALDDVRRRTEEIERRFEESLLD